MKFIQKIILISLWLAFVPLIAADKKPITKEESAKVIEAGIRKAAKKPTGELTKADYEKVTRLNLGNNRVTDVKLTDVKGLENLTQLKNLILGGHKVTDVTALEKLTKLTELQLYDNQLTELPKGLENLTQLKSLHLSNTELTDLTALEKLTELTDLYLQYNQLTELPKGLEKLEQLTSHMVISLEDKKHDEEFKKEVRAHMKDSAPLLDYVREYKTTTGKVKTAFFVAIMFAFLGLVGFSLK